MMAAGGIPPKLQDSDSPFEAIVNHSSSTVAGGKSAKNYPEPGKISEDQGRVMSAAESINWDERLLRAVNFSGQISEAFRVLRSKILMPLDGRQAPKTIMVTSVLPKEGKTFVTANLGIALAQCVDQYSLLVDCDLRLPSLAKLLGVPDDRGLSDYLRNKAELADLIRKTSMEKLSIIASGIPPANPAELLGSARMHGLVGELSSRYPDRFVIFDSPPLQVASESMVLAQVVDGVVLVVRYGVSTRSLVEKAIEEIGKQKIIGMIFNGHKENFIISRFINKNYLYYEDYYRGKKK
ncbi:MAG: polysaccharide biosynthesis tyrosine autokinase [Desulforhopalus sp.]|nr:polysaccharide biosynthesis tyrosine autokinase [Desulforhopalus sp.]